jgi:hypothetical protein
MTLAQVVIALGSAETMLECNCIHGDHEVCPMHHKPAPGSTICLMQNSDDSGVAVFSWLLNAGVLPRPTQPIVPERQHISAPIELTTASLRPAPPDPPPPRA